MSFKFFVFNAIIYEQLNSNKAKLFQFLSRFGHGGTALTAFLCVLVKNDFDYF